MKVIEQIKIKNDIKKVLIRPLFYLSTLVLTGCNTAGRSLLGENTGLVHRSSAPSVVAVASSSSSGDDISSAPSDDGDSDTALNEGNSGTYFTNFIGSLSRAGNVRNYLKFIGSFGLLSGIVSGKPTFPTWLETNLPSIYAFMGSSDSENLRNECGRICGRSSVERGYSTNNISSLCSSITWEAIETYYNDFESNHKNYSDKYKPTLKETGNLEREAIAFIEGVLQRNNYTDCLPSWCNETLTSKVFIEGVLQRNNNTGCLPSWCNETLNSNTDWLPSWCDETLTTTVMPNVTSMVAANPILTTAAIGLAAWTLPRFFDSSGTSNAVDDMDSMLSYEESGSDSEQKTLGDQKNYKTEEEKKKEATLKKLREKKSRAALRKRP